MFQLVHYQLYGHNGEGGGGGCVGKGLRVLAAGEIQEGRRKNERSDCR